MRSKLRLLLLALACVAPAPWMACSGGESSSTTSSGGGNATTANTGSGGSNTAGTGGSSTTGTGGSGTTSSAGGGGSGNVGGGTSVGTGGSGGTGGANTGGGSDTGGGGPVDAGKDVDFSYDAGPMDSGVTEDSACAADVAQAETLPVDIIWAVDTSGSMSEEIAQIKANINNSFANIIAASGLDYRVVMIANKGTSTYEVCVAPPLGGANCGNNPPIFRSSDTTVNSTDALSKILSTYDNATASIAWNKFLRPNAVKVFIVVTDDNSSLSAASFETQLFAKQPAGMFGTAQKRNYIFYGIIGVLSQNNIASKCASAVNNGAAYHPLIKQTNGQAFPVCAADYSPIFNSIATGIVGKLACEYAMPKAGGGGAIDPANVWMQFDPSNGPAVTVPKVDSAAQCAGEGWYYDDPANPTKLILCPNSCSAAQADNGGKIQILVGCLPG